MFGMDLPKDRIKQLSNYTVTGGTSSSIESVRSSLEIIAFSLS